MQEKAVVEDVSFGDKFETVNNIIVLWIAVWCEELLHNLEEEEDLTEFQEKHEAVIVKTKRHYVQIEKHVGQDDNADDYAEAQHPKAIGI